MLQYRPMFSWRKESAIFKCVNMNNSYARKSFVSVRDLTKEAIDLVFQEANAMKELVTTRGKIDIFSGKIISCVFYEPSTRTFASFMSAAQRLGAGVIPFHGMMYSSMNKGETLEDTIRTLGCSSDAIVLRHPEEGVMEAVAAYSYVPVINAGDGAHEHPTQALLDAYTIYTRYPSMKDITVGFAGDLKHSRTIRSLSIVLAIYGVKKFVWIAPHSLKMEPDIAEAVKKHDVEIVETESLESIIDTLDVLYSNRIQKERFENPAEYEAVKNIFVITPKTLENAKKEMILLNPMPRVGEITPDVDSDHRALYIKEQMQNALYVRMAILKLILG